ncbi:polysaccharide biosynthesis/export family protein [Tropicimonas sediminicola]|uniref:Polysaccharide export outer membrane protein n=1 Tax=Tropicimonas sediminicola TaxID=1031541 RepID=A0A239LE12_9RHOB|nr:polysaccharide biosynthesis/export family protein [Tropicimonas sediminicola]SNT28721.1 polysaccharide export outer membrane protein [Tropicimonas sediminicola]
MRRNVRSAGANASLRGAGALAAALAAMFAGSGAMADEYRLQPGDVVGMSVAGLPEMNMTAAIQIDGSLSFPLVGPLEAAGLTIDETRSQIQTALASRLVTAYLPDGREILRALDRDQISASVTEYRPVFVSGDVAEPGRIPFHPGMTIRHAIAAAGGGRLVAAQATGENEIDLRADYAEAWQSAATASAQVWRLRQELGETIPFRYDTWPAAPLSGASLEDILQVEDAIRKARTETHDRQRSFLERTLNQIDAQIAVLQQLLEVAKANEAVDAEALAGAKDAIDRGLLNQARIADIRVAALLSSTRRLQTESSLMQLERRRTEVERERSRLVEERRLDLLSDLQSARVTEAREIARLSSADEKLRAAGLALPVPAGGDTTPLTASIIRDGVEIIGSVELESPVQPGDVVEVRRGQRVPTVAAHASSAAARAIQAEAALR